jgi:hypothetical protein
VNFDARLWITLCLERNKLLSGAQRCIMLCRDVKQGRVRKTALWTKACCPRQAQSWMLLIHKIAVRIPLRICHFLAIYSANFRIFSDTFVQ